jgi:hypothetical protein
MLTNFVLDFIGNKFDAVASPADAQGVGENVAGSHFLFRFHWLAAAPNCVCLNLAQLLDCGHAQQLNQPLEFDARPGLHPVSGGRGALLGQFAQGLLRLAHFWHLMEGSRFCERLIAHLSEDKHNLPLLGTDHEEVFDVHVPFVGEQQGLHFAGHLGNGRLVTAPGQHSTELEGCGHQQMQGGPVLPNLGLHLLEHVLGEELRSPEGIFAAGLAVGGSRRALQLEAEHRASIDLSTIQLNQVKLISIEFYGEV